MKPTISVIIPIYNSQKFLNKCLISIANQTFKDFEVIMIDDGSTDLSAEIAKGYSSEHENFTFISQVHSGQGMARNLGIKKAKGEFISFVDSDDYVHKDFLKKLYFALSENKADISCCQLRLYYPHNQLKLPMPSIRLKEGVYDKEVVFDAIIEDIRLNSFPFNKLFKRSLFSNKGCSFQKMYFEDMVLIPQLFFYSKKVVVISDTIYNYSQHGSSTLGSMNEKKIKDFITSLKYTKKFLKENNCYKDKIFIKRALKVKYINTFKIIGLHFSRGSFKNLLTNLHCMNKCINSIIKGEGSYDSKDLDCNFKLIIV